MRLSDFLFGLAVVLAIVIYLWATGRLPHHP